MFHNYLITALRNFSRHRLYSFINIAGLTVGLTCAIFIILFVRDELSYDKWIPGAENLYRVETTVSLPGRPPELTTRTPFIVPQTMLDQIPEVKAQTRLMPHPFTVRVGDRQFPETVGVVDPNFLDVIKLPLVTGNPAYVFAQTESAVLSQTLARKYFGKETAYGKTITVSAEYCDELGENCEVWQQPLTVTGILRDLPHNSQLAIDLLIPNTSKADPLSQGVKTSWGVFKGWGYVQLVPGADPKIVIAKLKTIIDRLDTKKLGVSGRGSDFLGPRLTLFQDDHLSTDRYANLGGDSMTPAGSWTTVYGFMAIGALILLVACFNFTNLATARAMVRAREISLRKVVGAARGQLIVQFLGESVLTAMISLVLALGLSEVLLPLFDRFVGAPIEFRYLRDWPVLLSLVGISVTIGLLSGAYPALVLSGMRPGLVLRSNNPSQSGSGLLRTILVVLQFAVSIGLGIAVLVVFEQISFSRHMELGFRKDGILLVDGDSLLPEARKSFIQTLRAQPGILGVTASDDAGLPFEDHENNGIAHWAGGPLNEDFRIVRVGPDYLGVYDMRVLAGRALSEKFSQDAVADERQSSTPFNILINETAARRMGDTPQSAVGKAITINNNPATIIGVVADSKLRGVSESIPPTIYRDTSAYMGQISVRVADQRLPESLAFIDRTWNRFAPSTAIKRHFLNEDFEKQFLAEQREGAIFSLFVGIAIFIASLGLFGLAAFATERRTREIGIRKTFGAKTRDIIVMLLWQFSIPVLIANLIAWPVAYFYLRHWLDGYAYRISLNPLYFVGVSLAALVIAWATVFIHANRVARANPIRALRYE